MNRHVPRQNQCHAGTAEENTYDGQDDEGREQECGDKKHALFGVGAEGFSEPVVQQNERQRDDRQRHQAIRDQAWPGCEPVCPIEQILVQQNPDRSGNQCQAGGQQRQGAAATRAEVDADAFRVEVEER